MDCDWAWPSERMYKSPGLKRRGSTVFKADHIDSNRTYYRLRPDDVFSEIPGSWTGVLQHFH